MKTKISNLKINLSNLKINSSNLKINNLKINSSNLKIKIPKALREQVWLHYFGRKFEHKCYVRWCNNKINVFDFHAGHDIPESKGGVTVLENLRPICSRCNLSMGSKYSINEWNTFGNERKDRFCFFCLFRFF